MRRTSKTACGQTSTQSPLPSHFPRSTSGAKVPASARQSSPGRLGSRAARRALSLFREREISVIRCSASGGRGELRAVALAAHPGVDPCFGAIRKPRSGLVRGKRRGVSTARNQGNARYHQQKRMAAVRRRLPRSFTFVLRHAQPSLAFDGRHVRLERCQRILAMQTERDGESR